MQDAPSSKEIVVIFYEKGFFFKKKYKPMQRIRIKISQGGYTQTKAEIKVDLSK
jgi:hypothetical protein